jgi:serine/threonine protein kinase
MNSSRLQEGSLLGGRYEILEIVGKGGMGTVYRARDNRLEIIVAVKEMQEKADTSHEQETAVRQFEREAKLLAQLTHRNLPRVTDYFVDGTRWYLIMEFINGSTLESKLREFEGQPLPLTDVLSWGIQLADVLDFLHTQNPPIVFRDMKPANVMLQQDGVIRLIDFGIARRFQAGATKDTLLYGSPGYSPPEQYGRSQTDSRCDIYALGASLHHLLTGRDPATTPFKFPPLRSLSTAFPPSLETLIARCVEMEPEKRVQTAAEVRDSLIQIRNAVIAAEGARANLLQNHPAPSPGGRIVSNRLPVAQSRSKKRWVAISLIIALLLLGAGMMAMRMRSPGRVVRDPSPQKSDTLPKAMPAPDQPPSPGNLEPGTLKITSSPSGVMLELNGQPLGRTPFQRSQVPPGKHTIRLIPAAESGLPTVTREIELQPGQTLPITVNLYEPQDKEKATAQIIRTEAQISSDSQAGGSNALRGVTISIAFRVQNAAGKSGTVGAYFYGADKSTPLSPAMGFDSFKNSEGQLCVSRSYTAMNNPQDFPSYQLFIPETVFTTPYPQTTYRIIVFLDGKAIGQSDMIPLTATP